MIEHRLTVTEKNIHTHYQLKLTQRTHSQTHKHTNTTLLGLFISSRSAGSCLSNAGVESQQHDSDSAAEESKFGGSIVGHLGLGLHQLPEL